MNDRDEMLFAGLRVLDVGTWIAGPVAATILADFGASVIKIEAPETGDPYRRLPQTPMMPQAAVNYSWLADGRNKRSITLNLKADEGRAILRRLVQTCDVYITNQPLPMRRRFALTYEDLAPLNPRMIYASITGFGDHLPHATRVGSDIIAQAYTGLMAAEAKLDEFGALMSSTASPVIDRTTGMATAMGICAALYHRERTGIGQELHVSLLQSGLELLSGYVMREPVHDATIRDPRLQELRSARERRAR